MTEGTTVMFRLLRSSGLKHKQWSLTKHSCVVPKRSTIRVVMKISCCKIFSSWKSGKVVACSAVKVLVRLNYWRKIITELLLEKKTPPSYKLKNIHLIERNLKFYSRGSNVFYATSDSLEKKQDNCSSHYTLKRFWRSVSHLGDL